MFQHIKRHLMAEVDSGSGNGAATPVSTETPTPEPQAQGAQPAAIDVDAITAKVADSVFAALRKAGAFEKPKAPKSKDAEPATNLQQPQAVDAVKLRSLDRALSKHGVADRLSDAAYKRVEKAFAEDSPDDASSWVKDYFDGLGVAHPATQPAQTQAAQPAPKPATEHPVSNRGAPPIAQVPLEEADLVTMSESDRRAFIQSKGVRAYVQQLAKQLKGRPVQLR